MRLSARLPALAAALILATALAAAAQAPAPSAGQRYNRLLIRNAMVIDGAGNPARGPMDVIVEGSTIASVRPARPIDEFGTGRADSSGARARPAFDRVIDGT